MNRITVNVKLHYSLGSNLADAERNCKPVVPMIKAEIDRTYADTIKVTLPCGYTQKFWVDITDEEAIRRTKRMKKLGIK